MYATYVDDEVYHRLVDRFAEFRHSPPDGERDGVAVILVLAEFGIWPRSLSPEARGLGTNSLDSKPNREALITALSGAVSGRRRFLRRSLVS